uniref:Uncharacterized protein n=1 Tax=Meloidogyne enterolobii TaxID=390850 RepID=A0A6V7UQY1_MELEN|nr:unnamed protein product [Meloidogyne enterolobii]
MNQTQCIAAEASVLNREFNIVRVLFIILGSIIIVLLLHVVWSYKTNPLKLHTNIIILISNVLFLYAIFVLSYMFEAFMNFFVLFTYSDPCQCLIQVWLVYLLRMPVYIYNCASPMFHFFIMIERVLATIFAKIYENQGKIFGIISTIIVWGITLIYCLYIYITTRMDTNTFSHPMVYTSLTTIYNSQLLIYLSFIFLFFGICISIADYFLILRNRKIKSNFFNSSTNYYSLTKSYQTKQNILLMRTIFPLDFSYSFVFALFDILSTILRYNRDEYNMLAYVRNFEAIILLLFIHAIITLIVYEYFLKKQNEIRKNFVKINMNISSEIYFKNLNLSWK